MSERSALEQSKCRVAIPVINGMVVVSLFLHWFEHETYALSYVGWQMLFAARFDGTYGDFGELPIWGSIAVWTSVIAVATSAMLSRLPLRQMLHGTVVLGMIAVALVSAVILQIRLSVWLENPEAGQHLHTGDGIGLLIGSMILLGIAWIIRVKPEDAQIL